MAGGFIRYSFARPPGGRSLPLEDFRDEGFLFENREFLGFLAGTQETRRDIELVVDGHGDAAFAGAVELGDDETVERAGFVEFLGLLHGVRAGGGINHEER